MAINNQQFGNGGKCLRFFLLLCQGLLIDGFAEFVSLQCVSREIVFYGECNGLDFVSRLETGESFAIYFLSLTFIENKGKIQCGVV